MDGMFQDVVTVNKECATYYIGHARAIKNLYEHLEKNSVYSPLYPESPRFNTNRIYGLEIDLVNEKFFVISETDACYLLMGELKNSESEIETETEESKLDYAPVTQFEIWLPNDDHSGYPFKLTHDRKEAESYFKEGYEIREYTAYPVI